MGYYLSSLAGLPIEENVNAYIFVIGDKYLGGDMEIIERNFLRIAQDIGPNAVLATGFNHTDWTDEVGKKFLGKDYYDLFHLLPALLLTDSHPDNLSENSTKVLIPLSRVREKFGNIETFIGILTRYIKTQNPDLIDKFQFEEKRNLQRINEVLHLRPNFLGVGINLNALLKKITR